MLFSSFFTDFTLDQQALETFIIFQKLAFHLFCQSKFHFLKVAKLIDEVFINLIPI